MSKLPPQAITATAIVLHDDECNGGDTHTCGRWRSPAHARHIEYYREKAASVLKSAAPAIRAQERQRIIAIAVDHGAVYADDNGEDHPFDELLGGEA